MSAVSFDSNILIDALNGDRRALREIDRAEQAWISRVTWIEILSTERGATMVSLRQFIDGFSLDEVDLPIAIRAAALRRERSKLKLADSIILASAMEAGRILVTRNTKDFPAGMPGIRVPYTI